MRIPTSKLQHLAIFTTVLTGGGIGTMYYLMQSECTYFIFLCPQSHLVITALQLVEHHIWPLSACPLQLYTKIQPGFYSGSVERLFHCWTMPKLSEIRMVHSIIVPFQNKIRKWKNWFCNLFERHSLIECNTELEPQQLLSFQSAKELERNPQFQAHVIVLSTVMWLHLCMATSYSELFESSETHADTSTSLWHFGAPQCYIMMMKKKSNMWHWVGKRCNFFNQQSMEIKLCILLRPTPFFWFYDFFWKRVMKEWSINGLSGLILCDQVTISAHLEPCKINVGYL